MRKLINAAKAYIADLVEHEGAEGFSVSTAERAAEWEAALAEYEVMRNMETAPQDGTRILLCYRPVLYISRHGGATGIWMPQDPKWEECRWVSDEERTGSPAHYEPYCGNDRTHSSEHIKLENCLGWLPVPGEET